MQVTKPEVEQEFKPITLQLKIETQKELDMLQEFCNLDYSLPLVVFKFGSEKFTLCQDFLKGIQDALRN